MTGERFGSLSPSSNRHAILPIYHKFGHGRSDVSKDDGPYMILEDEYNNFARSMSNVSIPRFLPEYHKTVEFQTVKPLVPSRTFEAIPTTDIAIPLASTSNKPQTLDSMEKILLYFTLYRKLFFLALALNLAALIAVTQQEFGYAKRNIVSFALGNLMCSILARNEFALRIAYWLVVQTLYWTPIRVRNFITAMFVNLGGIHSGCATAGLMWSCYAAYMSFHAHTYPRAILVFAILTPIALTISIIVAMPYVRHNHHDIFEKFHRFVGWLGLAYLWILVVLLESYDPSRKQYRVGSVHWAKKQEFWFTVIISTMIIAPWLSLTKIPVKVSAPSAKTVFLTFPGGIYTGLIGRISRSPLFEWHAFGIISEGPLAFTHHMLIVAQGDWTKALISDPPDFVWTRGLRFAGLPYLAEMYERGVIVATGAGLGVTLSVYLQTKGYFYLIWIGSDLEQTYGEEVMSMLRKAVKGDRATLIDTKKTGRPDTIQLIDNIYRKIDAQVVFITSNPKGTELMVNGCQARGMTAFGPLFDS